MKSNLLRRAGSVASVAVTLALLGCGSGSSGAPPATAADTTVSSAPAATAPGQDTEGANLVEHHRHHHGGLAMFLVMSLDSLGLTGSQMDQAAAVRTNLEANLTPVRQAEANVLSTIADGVAAGSVDTAKADAAIAQFDATTNAAHTASLDALDRLHTILDPAERAALVEKLNAHLEVSREANTNEEEPAHRGRLTALTTELGLSADQVERIRTALRAAPPEGGAPQSADMDAKIHAFGTAFQGNDFNAKTLNSGNGEAPISDRGIRKMARFYEAAAPVLTPDQRAKVAARLREHAGREGK